MAVPDTLTAWRTFVAHHPVQPPTLTPRRLRALSPAATADYHTRRIAWLAADVVLETPHIIALERQMRILLARNTSYTATARRGLALSGAAGLGKSTAALLIGKRHERRMRAHRPAADSNFAPVVYIVAPPGATPKMLMLAFATWLGLITHPRATAQDITDHVVAVLRDLGTTLVIVDEVHNLRTNNPVGAQAASALKVFSERLDATFCYVGIDLPAADLYTGDMGRQIKARTILHDIRPYTHTTLQARDQWTALILGLEALLPLHKHRRGSLAGHATYIYDRTGGSIGSLRALLTDAAIAAIQEETERIDRPLLESIQTDRAATEHHADVKTHARSRMPITPRR
jgi:hypothetical protein